MVQILFTSDNTDTQIPRHTDIQIHKTTDHAVANVSHQNPTGSIPAPGAVIGSAAGAFKPNLALENAAHTLAFKSSKFSLLFRLLPLSDH